MIRNENEYREAVGRLADEKLRINAQRAELKKMGLTTAEIKRAVDPILSFHLQLEEEVQSYDASNAASSMRFRICAGWGSCWFRCGSLAG